MLSGFKVLIIDDSLFDRELCGDLLGSSAAAHQIHSAGSCKEGLEALRAHPDTDCILLDLHMPDGLGSEMIEKIHDISTKAAVVMLTGDSDMRIALNCLKKGADDYLIKGEFSSAALDRTIRYAVERRKALLEQQALQLALKREQELNEAQHEFICLVAHEFKTPLGIISSAIQLLQAVDDPALLLEKQAGKIELSVKRLTGLMDNVLLLQKLEDKKMAGGSTDFNISRLITSICRTLEEDGAVRIAIKELPDILTASGAQALCEYTLSNIIKNALKYSAPDSPVTLHVLSDARFANIYVQDCGRGMNSETLSRIGERFMRGEGAFSQAGIGLGLYIATQFASHAGGAIYFCSEEGVGTSVMVKWPLAQA